MKDALTTLFAGLVAAVIFFGGIVLFVKMTEKDGLAVAANKINNLSNPTNVTTPFEQSAPELSVSSMPAIVPIDYTKQSQNVIDENDYRGFLIAEFGKKLLDNLNTDDYLFFKNTFDEDDNYLGGTILSAILSEVLKYSEEDLSDMSIDDYSALLGSIVYGDNLDNHVDALLAELLVQYVNELDKLDNGNPSYTPVISDEELEEIINSAFEEAFGLPQGSIKNMSEDELGEYIVASILLEGLGITPDEALSMSEDELETRIGEVLFGQELMQLLNDYENSQNNASSVSSSNNVQSVNGFHFIDATIEPSEFSDDNCVVVYFDYTNTSSNTSSFMSDYHVKAFQDGIELDYGSVYNDATRGSTKELLPGATLRVAEDFTLRSNSPVYVQVEPWFNWDNEVLYSITINLQ